MKPTQLKTIRIRNFKAIRDSGTLKLAPLTVLIGNNGSGKSSVVEGLETLHTFVVSGLDRAMQAWRGIEHVRNQTKGRQARRDKAGDERSSKPIEFHINGLWQGKSFAAQSSINERHRENELFVERESVTFDGATVELKNGRRSPAAGDAMDKLTASRSLLYFDLGEYIHRWQFLSLWPQVMGNPVPQTRSKGSVGLAKDGSNIAQYLLDLRDANGTDGLAAFDAIVEMLKYVLPYAADLQPALTSELERNVYLQMAEGSFKVPGWLLSTGTLRIISLLALLRHPNPPPLIVIEEVENGLDPRTIHLLVETIQEAVGAGRTQVLMTTHSPYLLDLLPLSCIVLADRIDGEPRFTRPADNDSLRKWAESFSPGQLYTMSRLRGMGDQ